MRDAFYNYFDGLLDLADELDQHDLDGNYARFSEKALRIAMLFAAIERTTVIEMRHWARAQEITEEWRVNLHDLVAELEQRPPKDRQEVEDQVLEQLTRLSREKGRCTAREIAQRITGPGFWSGQGSPGGMGRKWSSGLGENNANHILLSGSRR